MEVRTVAVIGAGIMGRGIAHAAALGGYRTILEDILPSALRRAGDEIRSNLDKAVELGKVTADEAREAMGRMEYAGAVDEAARAADLVIEAVPEEMESEDRDLHPAGQNLPVLDHCRVEHVLAEHHRNCVGHLPAETCVRHALLQPGAHDEAAGDCARLGDQRRHAGDRGRGGPADEGEVVVIKESPGFITSRINAMIGNEAFCMLQERHCQRRGH